MRDVYTVTFRPIEAGPWVEEEMPIHSYEEAQSRAVFLVEQRRHHVAAVLSMGTIQWLYPPEEK